MPTNPCQNGGQCTSTSVNYQCDCTGTGYTGTVCTDVIPTGEFREEALCILWFVKMCYIDPCATNLCQNGGQCSWDGVTTSCLCFNGYGGSFCQIPPGRFCLWNVHKLKTKCYYIVPCASAPCENGGTCQLLATNTYGCVCPAEFTGARCETSILGTVIVLPI